MSWENAAKVIAGEASGWPAKVSTGAAGALGERNWHLASIALLSVRVIQGFIYWGGGMPTFTRAVGVVAKALGEREKNV